ncbi:MAG TPA: YncE family protein [Candidatus Acidoferrales bacterium]|nr:YncE family protein [Candidatus Acidoferrales bacterium]
MKRKMCFLIMAIAFAGRVACAQQNEPLRLLQTVSLPNVHGRIDHFDVDLMGQRLFMSALGNNTLEVFDLRSNRVIHTIRGLGEPQGVTYVPKSKHIFVANGDDGTCRMFDGSTYKLLKTVRLSSDADDTRYDSATNQVFIGYGDGADAGLAILDGTTGNLVGTIKLPDHPESFQLDDAAQKIYVNVPSANNIVDVLDRRTREIVGTWTLGGARDNFPMALDEPNHRLFIICRNPAEVLILDTDSGRIIARVPSVSHADDAWYDSAKKRAYVSGGGGFITVVQQQVPDHYREVAQFRTAEGARTSCLVPQLNRLYLGVWRQRGGSDELQVYKIP